MADNTIDWGQGANTNSINWGSGASNNTNGWGVIHDMSYGHPETDLVGIPPTPPEPAKALILGSQNKVISLENQNKILII
jgi:hypothetical protein